jgi:aspartate carbamoyltransferase catalytic subunit
MTEKQPNPFSTESQDFPFKDKDILSVEDFNRENIEHTFNITNEMYTTVQEHSFCDFLKGKVLANLFYEPSTRTSSSFTSAMERLGGSVISINNVSFSSVTKGESLPDTIRTLEGYADVIVLRHPEVGSSALAAKYARKPIINAGDGVGEHPTQALLDLYTIKRELGRTDNLTVTMMGDLKHGRTIHSLARLLTLYDNINLNYVSPKVLEIPSELQSEIKESGTIQTTWEKLEEILPDTDVLYVTRVQKERFEDPTQYEELKGGYCITAETMKLAKDKMALMHPLPRVWEIDLDVDKDPRATYFRQSENGQYVRMALLAMVLGKRKRVGKNQEPKVPPKTSQKRQVSFL